MSDIDLERGTSTTATDGLDQQSEIDTTANHWQEYPQ
jgi:hypothetical protein